MKGGGHAAIGFGDAALSGGALFYLASSTLAAMCMPTMLSVMNTR